MNGNVFCRMTIHRRAPSNGTAAWLIRKRLEIQTRLVVQGSILRGKRRKWRRLVGGLWVALIRGMTREMGLSKGRFARHQGIGKGAGLVQAWHYIVGPGWYDETDDVMAQGRHLQHRF